MNKILVSAKLFNEILERQPEIELELVRNAVPQIATMLAARAQQTKAQVEARVEEAWKELERTKNNPYGMPRQIREIIIDFLRGECRDEAKILVAQEAGAIASKAADEAVARAMLKLGQDVEKAISRGRAEVDEYIKEVAEREVLALLRAGKLQVAA